LKEENGYEVILLDILFVNQKLQGRELFDQIRYDNPDIPVIVISNTDHHQSVVEFIRRGAVNYFVKAELQIDKLALEIRNAVELYREKRKNFLLRYKVEHSEPGPLVFQSEKMKQLVAQTDQIASVNTSVLILGESGTGKELVANMIHERSPRSTNPFLKINCATIPPSLAESTLFGHEAGAFTDAKKSKSGLFEVANRGTLFLDEIAEMSLDIQAKFLRVLETGIITRVGEQQNERKVNVRIIAATNKNLQNLVKTGKFREDLYYRLNVYSIQIPPLRERPEDIELLTLHFIKKANEKLGTTVKNDVEAIMPAIKSYHWPGNVRQLENAVEAAVINCRLQNAEKLSPEMFQVFYETFQVNRPSLDTPPDSDLSTDNLAKHLVEQIMESNYNYVRLEATWREIMIDVLKRLIVLCNGDGKK